VYFILLPRSYVRFCESPLLERCAIRKFSILYREALVWVLPTSRVRACRLYIFNAMHKMNTYWERRVRLQQVLFQKLFSAGKWRFM
jgi:hypothetical protein